MNQKALKIVEKAIHTSGRWVWLKIANDSIQLEFEDVQLYKPTLDKFSSHSSQIAIRLFGNAFFTILYNDNKDLKFFDYNKNDFSYKIANDKLKFQDFDFLKELVNDYQNKKILIGNSLDDIFNGEIDFFFSFVTDKIAIVCAGNQIQFFNNFKLLSDNDIKELSNKWCVYWVDYWKKKGTANEYEYDPSCESIDYID